MYKLFITLIISLLLNGCSMSSTISGTSELFKLATETCKQANSIFTQFTIFTVIGGRYYGDITCENKAQFQWISHYKIKSGYTYRIK